MKSIEVGKRQQKKKAKPTAKEDIYEWQRNLGATYKEKRKPEAIQRGPTGEKKAPRRKEKQGKEHLGKAAAEQNKQGKLETRNKRTAEPSQRRKGSKVYKTTDRRQWQRKKE